MQNNFECKNGIYLEPRLQEYLKKKMYYKKNKINPGIPLEREFNISSEDVRRLKAFRSGDKDIYNHKKQDNFLDEYPEPTFDFDPDKAYKSDPRFHRFSKKMKRDKEAMRQRHNYDVFEDAYDNTFGIKDDDLWDENDRSRIMDIPDDEAQRINLLDGRDFDLEINTKKQREAFNSKYRCKNPNMSNRTYDNSIPSGYDMNMHRNNLPSRKLSKLDRCDSYIHNNNIEKPRENVKLKYDEIPQYTPNINFRNKMYPMQNNNSQQLPIDHNPRLKDIIGGLDTYRKFNHNTCQRVSEMDTDLKIVIPNVTCNGKKSLNSSSYRSVPCVGRAEGIRNIDDECEMKNSMPTRGSKSYGYSNPVEHYYDYISDDIQDPDHVVFNPGIATRLDNHKVARPYKREILN